MGPNMETNTSEDEKIKILTSKYPEHFEILSERNKVVCKLTKHELPLNAAAIQTYIDGKKFQYYLKKVKKPATLLKIDNKYAEHFRDSKKSSSRLYCTLTRKEINKQPHEIERYITGYKFLKAFKIHKEKKEKGIVETEPAEDEEEKGIEMEDGGDDEVPFYALSSGEEEEDVEDEGDDVVDEDIVTDDACGVTEPQESVDEQTNVDDGTQITEEVSSTSHVGKKRKAGKLSKAKKEKKKSKKLKTAGQ